MAPKIPRVLIVHSLYRTSGGEERMMEIEKECLEKAGIQTKVLLRKMDSQESLTSKTQAALGLFRAGDAAKELTEALQSFDPWTVHFHNTMPHWGYSTVAAALDWALRKGRNVVSTIHNQRWACANGLFFRNGKHCQLCYERKNPLWGAVFNCRGNTSESLLYSTAIAWAWSQNIYNHPSHTLIALNQTTAQRLRNAFPAANIETLPNPIVKTNNPQSTTDLKARLAILPSWQGSQTAVIGRLCAEKGISRLIAEVLKSKEADPSSKQQTDKLTLNQNVRFLFAGAGPLENEILLAAKMTPRIAYLGRLPEEEIPSLLENVGCLFHAGLVEEQSPTVIRMAFKLKIPVYSYSGKLSVQTLNQWGTLLSSEEWSEQLLGLLRMKQQIKPRS